jgi:hypothetical protein
MYAPNVVVPASLASPPLDVAPRLPAPIVTVTEFVSVEMGTVISE